MQFLIPFKQKKKRQSAVSASPALRRRSSDRPDAKRNLDPLPNAADQRHFTNSDFMEIYMETELTRATIITIIGDDFTRQQPSFPSL